MKQNKNLFDVKGKVVVVTGALGQLGTGLIHALAEQGSKIVISDLDNKKCIERAKLINKRYGNVALGHGCDVSDEQSVQEMFETVIKKFGNIDALINNAGIGVYTPFEERTVEEIQKVVDVNIKGVILCSKAVADHMKKRKTGSIINIASIYGIVSPDKRIYGDSKRNSSEIYGMTKAGIINFTKYLATYLAEYNIRVNAISPGGIFNNQKEFFVRNYINKTPLGRMAKVEDITGAVVFLISDASSYITDNNLVIDGGFTAW